jgi:hypothetical protein
MVPQDHPLRPIMPCNKYSSTCIYGDATMTLKASSTVAYFLMAAIAIAARKPRTNIATITDCWLMFSYIYLLFIKLPTHAVLL